MVNETQRNRGSGTAWCHVDMDGLDAIFRGHGHHFDGQDAFYESAVDNSLAFFAERGIRATYFLIARDLDDAAKRNAVRRVVDAGHRIASHGLNHEYLNRIDDAGKREEIFASKQKIEDVLGVSCEGFRAPGYSIDNDSLDLLREAGYRYDTSMFPTYAFRKRLGVQRLFDEPFLLFPDDKFFEIPLPAPGPGLPPFHPCYAFYLGGWYFRRNLKAFARRFRYLTLLFHLTDFSARQRIGGGVRLNLYTNNYLSAGWKRRFLGRLVDRVEKDFTFTTTEAFLDRWPESAPDLNPRTILGISTTHETGACVVRDGEVLSAINEERLSRKKLDAHYPPERSIREAIRLSGVEPASIDAVAIAGLHWRDLLPQTLDSLKQDVRDYHALNDYFPHLCRILYRLYYFSRAVSYKRVLDFMEHEYGVRPKVYHIEHHEAHAWSAFRGGLAEKALVVTADGVGDDVCMTISRGDRRGIRREATLFYPHSFGHFYTAVTQILGFKAGRHEGKITGLSGYGRPDPELIARVEQTLKTDGNGFRLNKRYYAEGFIRPKLGDMKMLLRGRIDPLTVEYRNYKMPLRRALRGKPREAVAYAFQHLLEREVVRLTKAHLNSAPEHLVLAGGLFANVKLNMALSQGLRPESIFIYPNMGDGGLCVGAALGVTGQRSPASHMYLGTAYGEDELANALERNADLVVERPGDMAATIAQALVDGRIVARFDGRMEFGPRALGNRSILYHCADRSVNDWLNTQLKRTEFMPFAPICPWEDAERYFILRDGEKHACEFMTLVVRCTDLMQETCPAAVHVDGTARPQLVRREINPGMYAILEEYRRRTGISCLINTSFNMHEEPIVRSPDEAITAFRQSHLHHLVLGPFLVSQAAASQQQRD